MRPWDARGGAAVGLSWFRAGCRGGWTLASGCGIPVLAVLLVTACAARAAAPEDILQRALERLQANTRAFSKYACIETVERRYYEPPQPPAAGSCAGVAAETDKLDAIDRLRLEVTVSGNREIYSWPGATRFDSRDISEIVREGPIATGSFGTHLLAVFNNPRVDYRYVGEETRGGRRLLEYRFHVPLAASQYQVRVGSRWDAIAYDGSFQVDAGSLEIVSFRAEAPELPPATSICRLQAGLDYDPNSGANRGFLLPVQSRLRIDFAGGRRIDNLTTFSNCREYQAESQVVFEGSSATAQEPSAPAPWTSLALPIGLPVALALEAPVDTGNAAAGDPVSARVVTPVRQPGTGAVLIPAGAIAHGRLTRVEHHLQPKPYFLVAMSFNRLDWQGVSSPFGAHSESGDKAARDLGANLAGQGGGFRFWDSGVFVFPTARPRYVIPAGFETRWITLAPRLR